SGRTVTLAAQRRKLIIAFLVALEAIEPVRGLAPQLSLPVSVIPRVGERRQGDVQGLRIIGFLLGLAARSSELLQQGPVRGLADLGLEGLGIGLDVLPGSTREQALGTLQSLARLAWIALCQLLANPVLFTHPVLPDLELVVERLPAGLEVRLVTVALVQ